MKRATRFMTVVPICGLAVAYSFEAGAQSTCSDGGAAPAALVSYEGSVRIARADGSTVSPALGMLLCPGDRISTGDASGVDLRFDAKNSVTNVLSSSTIVIPPRREADVTLTSGLMRFISSVRGTFRIRTPNTDAGIDGTEAMLVVDGPATDTLVLVREGVVTVADRRQDARIPLAAGEASYSSQATILVRATPENVPAKFRGYLLNPNGAADWAVYYPPILFGTEGADPAIRRAAELLDAGEPDRAEDALAAYDGPQRGLALALRAMTAVFRNRIDDGARLAAEAVAAAPDLGPAHIAMSYVDQAEGNLAAARDAAVRATRADPDDAYAWARLAELQLTIGHRHGAVEAAQRSLGIAETSLAHAVLGFAHLSNKDRDEAESAFGKSIALDSQDPLPRLGLGLSMISRGQLEAGRAEIETSASLDPQRAQLRTWLGRAYMEERRGEKAAAQFNLATEQDPDDPAPWQLLAEQQFAANRPVEALRSLGEADDRADRRATIRGDRGLGEDRSVRAAAEGRIYDVLGFEILATRAGGDAVFEDPTNPGSHLFLADVYRSRPAFQIAQTSEMLAAQLLSKPSKNPVQPSLTEADLALLDTTGTARVSFHEFAPLFDGDGVYAVGSAAAGTTALFEDEVSLSLLHGNYSLAVSQFHTQTTGFRPNDDVRHEVVSIEAKAQVTPDLTLTAEGRYRFTDEGDRFLRSFSDVSQLRSQTERERLQFTLGGHAELSPNNSLLFVGTIAEEDETEVTSFIDPFFNVPIVGTADGETQSVNVEIQDTILFPWGNIIVGGFFGYSDEEGFFDGDPIFGFGVEATTLTGYVYGHIRPIPEVELTLGVSVDHTDRTDANPGFDAFFNDIVVSADRDFTQVNPKFGLKLEPVDGVVLRGAYARTLNRDLVQDRTLEPTTIAGFSQFFDDFAQTDTHMFGAGMDVEILDGVWLVGEYQRRRLDIPALDFDPVTFNLTVPTLVDGVEQTWRGRINATFWDNWAASAGVEFSRNETDLLDRPDDVETFMVPVALRYFDPTGFFGGVEAIWFDQQSTGQAILDDGVLLAIDTNEEGLILNASIGYRFPNERGVASIEVNNILDQSFLLQNSSVNSARPLTRPIAQGLSVIGRITLGF